jgi:hypothetical protein
MGIFGLPSWIGAWEVFFAFFPLVRAQEPVGADADGLGLQPGSRGRYPGDLPGVRVVGAVRGLGRRHRVACLLDWLLVADLGDHPSAPSWDTLGSGRRVAAGGCAVPMAARSALCCELRRRLWVARLERAASRECTASREHVAGRAGSAPGEAVRHVWNGGGARRPILSPVRPTPTLVAELSL